MRFAWIIPAFLLAGCASPGHKDGKAAPHARLGEEFRLALGESLPLENTPYSLVFSRVIEDSRCPSGVSCVWEGNARVQILLREYSKMGESGGKPIIEVLDQTMELNTSSRFPTPPLSRDLHLELRSLEPAPRADSPTQGYVVTLFVRRP
jgi:hypothetical protein